MRFLEIDDVKAVAITGVMVARMFFWEEITSRFRIL